MHFQRTKRRVRVGLAAAVFAQASSMLVPSIAAARPRQHAAPAPSVNGIAPTNTISSASAASPKRPQRRRAWLRLDAANAKPWVGQAIPVTVTAYFRDVEGVTLEGLPRLVSQAIVTTDLNREPRQSVETIDGERALVVRWSATVTPTSPGPLDLAVSLPVRIRHRDMPESTFESGGGPDPFGDPFADLDDATSIDELFARMQQRMMRRMERPAGRLHEEKLDLSAAVPAIETRELPAAGRPASFDGAVGTFDVGTSVSSPSGAVSEPLTLRMVVRGSGDLDRVNLGGLEASGDWKVYPAKVVESPAPNDGTPGAARSGVRPPSGGPRGPQKVFEQVVVPLRAGALVVPPIGLTTFDPSQGRYVTHASAPLTVDVRPGASGAEPVSSSSAGDPAKAGEAGQNVSPTPSVGALVAAAREHGPVVVAILAVLAALVGIVLALRRKTQTLRREWSLRRAMRRAVAHGRVDAFLLAARELVTTRLARRWGIAPEEISARGTIERLGIEGRPMADVLVADDARRFGAVSLSPEALQPLCAALEQALRRPTVRPT